MSTRFEWDEWKNVRNQQKHGVSFTEAITIFLDPNSVTLFDTHHATIEERYIDIDLSRTGRLL